MSARSKVWVPRIVLIAVALGSTITSASAVSVGVARKCSTLASEAFPPREVGNPAAGFLKGSARDKQGYYQRCVVNEGNMDDQSPGQAK